MLKTKFIIAALLCTGLGASAQITSVSGELKGFKEEQVVFYYYKGDKSVSDTIKVKDGKFSWKPNLSEPQKVGAMLFQRYFQFFAEPGNISVTGGPAVEDLKVTGSKSQDEYEAYDKTLKDLDDLESPLYQKWGKGTKEAQVALEEKVDSLRNVRRSRNDKYIAAHPKSSLSLSLVADKAMMGTYDKVQAAYATLDKSAQATAAGKRIAERLVLLERSAIGTPMLDFTQNDTEGKPVRFADFKGKYVLVDFWASWCGPCRAENPNVLKAYNQYKDKNFTVVGVSLDDKGENWKKAIKDDNMPWTQVSDLKGWKNEVSTYYGIMGIPSTLLVDPQGKIIAKDLRGEMLNKKLAELFNAGSTGSK
ncbi:MAG TPA: TlpA disulfide reductase family protein [Pedobacter sp.]|uniref:TlpA disulfide reductase family protein n=1 Tax=Pedobacter sp. TaxID=1411316 RepID=UPI002B794270|nr:TlpA disulfide reductase family protein [Pedobacter sp.]HMI05819.1 TlpA disulfide reductase family protein [Pedobacter sp.]